MTQAALTGSTYQTALDFRRPQSAPSREALTDGPRRTVVHYGSIAANSATAERRSKGSLTRGCSQSAAFPQVSSGVSREPPLPARSSWASAAGLRRSQGREGSWSWFR